MRIAELNPSRYSRLRAAVIWSGSLNILIAAGAMVGTLPGRTIGLGLITEPLLADLRVGRVEYGVINLWATLLGSTFALVFGPLADLIGARVVLWLNVLLLGATVLRMAHVHAVAELALMITLTRGLGQSALSTVSLALVGKWFVRRLNTAMGVYAAMVAIGYVLAVPALQYGVQTMGWRPAWASVGWALLGFGVACALLARGVATPASVLGPESNRAAPVAALGPPSPVVAVAPGLTLHQTLSTPTFWVLAVSCSAFNLMFSAVALFAEAILRERELYTPGLFRAAMGTLVAAGLAGNGAAAWLLNRMRLGRVLAIGMLAVTCSMLVLPLAHAQAAVLVFALMLGIAGGVVTVVFFACWPRLFGAAHVGKIQGAAQVMTVLFSAAGPLLLALGQRQGGSYSKTFLLMAPLFALLAAACWLVRAPRVQSRPATGGGRSGS